MPRIKYKVVDTFNGGVRSRHQTLEAAERGLEKFRRAFRASPYVGRGAIFNGTIVPVEAEWRWDYVANQWRWIVPDEDGGEP